MKRVWAVPNINHATKYFATKREAQSHFEDNEDEGVELRDAVLELNEWAEAYEKLDKERINLLVALKELITIADLDLLTETDEGRAAVNLLRQIEPDFIHYCNL